MVKTTRRQFLTVGAASAAAFALPMPARATYAVEKSRLIEIAKAELQRNAQQIVFKDRVGIADFSPYSSNPRFYLVDVEAGNISEFLVTHGRGSDPRHLGWLQSFSNVPGSNATSRGAYLTQEQYSGQHGRAMRLDGLDRDNSLARDRAIVVHSAWYAEPEMIMRTGKLGRSEGCFAFPSHQIETILARLGPGRLIFADKLASYQPGHGDSAIDDGAQSLWPSATFTMGS